MTTFGISERRACGLLIVWRSSCRYKPKPDRDRELREQLTELTTLVDAGELRAEVDSVFPLTEAQAAFERLAARGKRGKVVLQVGAD